MPSLAPFAMRVENSEGRRYPEPPHPYRNPFQRDRDRVIHAKAFRRLEKKTQVFNPNYSDHFRNRLTHTLEVSQIARTIGSAFCLNLDLCEVLALSHDIGHPPFSHAGEAVLDRIMRSYGSGFEHNLHALRIIEDFEERYARFRGLNLTFEVREGIVKHSRDYAPQDRPYVDIDCYRKGERPPLEAQLIDLADEVAYNAADLDDGYGSGLISLDQILEGSDLFRSLYLRIRGDFPTAPEGILVSETIRHLIDVLVTDLVGATRDRIRSESLDSVEAVRRFPTRVVGFGSEIAALVRQLKIFLRSNLYHHPDLERPRRKAEVLIADLFRYYEEDPARLPPAHYGRIEEHGVHRVVCDYIAGMTDSFARKIRVRISSRSG